MDKQFHQIVSVLTRLQTRKRNTFLVFLLCSILFIIPLVSKSQRTDSYSFHMQFDGWNGYYKSGILDTLGGASFDLSIGKYDSTGTKQWALLYGGSAKEHVQNTVLVNNQFYSLGYTYSKGAGLSDMLVVRVSPEGNGKAYIQGTQDVDAAVKLTEGASGNLLLTGNKNDGVQEDITLSVLDTGLTLLNDSMLVLDMGGNEKASSVFWDSLSGSILIGGYTDVVSGNGKDMLLIKLNAALEVEWSKVMTAPDVQEVNDITVDEYGDYYWVGYGGGATTAFVVVKTQPDGTIIWQKKYTPPVSGKLLRTFYHDQQNAIIGGGVIGAISGGTTDDFFTISLDTGGNINWSAEIPTQGYEYVTQLTLSDTGMIAAGPRLDNGIWSYQVSEIDLMGNGCTSYEPTLNSASTSFTDSVINLTVSEEPAASEIDTAFVQYTDTLYSADICLIKKRINVKDTLGVTEIANQLEASPVYVYVNPIDGCIHLRPVVGKTMNLAGMFQYAVQDVTGRNLYEEQTYIYTSQGEVKLPLGLQLNNTGGIKILLWRYYDLNKREVFRGAYKF